MQLTSLTNIMENHMPRRTKEDEMTTIDAATVAQTVPADATQEGSTTPASTEAATATPKPDRQPGPITTRTGAQALVINAPKGTRVFTAGGDKGAKIAELLTSKPEMSRKEIAALVGSSQSRVAEVARVLGLSKAREPKAEAVDTPAAEPANA
jgi:hypothetical protein